MKKSVVNKDGSMSIVDCDEVKVAPSKNELIAAYITERYDYNSQIAIMANYAAVSAGIATPPPDDVVAKYTREHEAFQKVRKEAKAYAKKVLGGADE